MDHFNLQSLSAPRVLGTDLDGTLIPLPDSEENRRDLKILAKGLSENKRELVFATGRHFESMLEAVEENGLPQPEWMICDVGTSIYHSTRDGFRSFGPYQEHLSEKIGGMDRAAVEGALASVDGLELQGEPSQGPFKISFFSEASRVEELEEQIEAICGKAGLPFTCMGSVDPFNGKGLLDLLPNGVSKAYALIWLATHADFRPEELVYAGDSGNDFAAIVAGFRSIAVGNASDKLIRKIETEMEAKGIPKRFYHATGKATSGVLEGCRHFGLL